jgi:PAS domain S-box-containing protein
MHELFLLATKHFYKQYKQNGGSQGDLATGLGITNSYLSSVINGSRQASLELQSRIAATLFGPYDKFLAVGRRIKEGLEPLEKSGEESLDPVEKLLAQLTHYVMDHQRIERDLKLSEEKYRDISLTSGDMIFEMDKDFRFIYVSGKVEEVTGKKAREILGKNYQDFLDDKEITRLKDLIRKAIQNGTILNTILTIHHGTDIKYRHLIAKPVYNTRGEFIGSRGTYRDITKRKNLEKELEQQNWLLQVALDSVETSGIVISDAHNNILKWNIVYKRIFSHSDKVLKTRDTAQYIAETRTKTADTELFDRDVKEALQSSKEIKHTFRLLDGRTIERKVIPLFRNGNLVGRIAHMKDVTSQQQ